MTRRLRAATRFSAAAFALAALGALARTGSAQGPSAPSASAPPAPPPPASASAAVTGCVESVPKGAQRPAIMDSFPPRGTSGWAASLSITIRHGKGERVLPSGLDLSAAVDAKKYLKEAGFVIPDQDGGAAARLWTEPNETPGPHGTVTHLELPLVALPPQPGRNVMTLPPLPVAIARANGELATVCTHPHVVVVEDPTADVPDAKPRENPPPRPQREEWTALKKAIIYGSFGLVAGMALAWLLYKHLTRPKPAPPPPPPRPPWEVALERLDEVRHAGLLESLRYTEYFDRVSDAVRGYLGARFGFDGLESTTDEILAALARQAGGFVRLDSGLVMEGPAPGIPLDRVASFLRECDLVKFANLTPTPAQCERSIVEGEAIVRATMPHAAPPPPPSRPSTRSLMKEDAP